MRYSSFDAFMHDFVLPLQQQHPGWRQLDGKSRSSPVTVAIFDHQNHSWEVHADTRFDPLLVAHADASSGSDPLVPEPSRSGKRMCLALRADLRSKTNQPRYKHLFIYQI